MRTVVSTLVVSAVALGAASTAAAAGPQNTVTPGR
jgi:hypothetical protein